jgi:hypothetical protein
MTDMVKVEFALDFAINQGTHKSRLAPPLSSGAAS